MDRVTPPHRRIGLPILCLVSAGHAARGWAGPVRLHRDHIRHRGKAAAVDRVLTGGMPLTGEYEPSSQTWVRDQVAAYEASEGTEANTLRDTGLPIVVITSRGSRSGKLRKNPVMRVEHDGSYAAVASKGGAPDNPAWADNLVAYPLVELQDGAERRDYRAREVTGEERAQWWERAVAAFPTYAAYAHKTDRVIPVFVLEPV